MPLQALLGITETPCQLRQQLPHRKSTQAPRVPQQKCWGQPRLHRHSIQKCYSCLHWHLPLEAQLLEAPPRAFPTKLLMSCKHLTGPQRALATGTPANLTRLSTLSAAGILLQGLSRQQPGGPQQGPSRRIGHRLLPRLQQLHHIRAQACPCAERLAAAAGASCYPPQLLPAHAQSLLPACAGLHLLRSHQGIASSWLPLQLQQSNLPLPSMRCSCCQPQRVACCTPARVHAFKTLRGPVPYWWATALVYFFICKPLMPWGKCTCREHAEISKAAVPAATARPLPNSLGSSGPQQVMGQGPVTKAIFKMGQGGCLEVHVSNHPPLREALQQ